MPCQYSTVFTNKLVRGTYLRSSFFITPRGVVLYVQFTLKQLAFLEHELEAIKDNLDREYEDRTIASEIFGKVKGEI